MSNASVQVTPCYPKETDGFVTEVIGLLDMHAEILDSQLRQALVKALILMRNRNTVRPDSCTLQLRSYQAWCLQFITLPTDSIMMYESS